MKAFKLWWQKQALRIDALSLRERAFLFLSIIVCCLAVVDTLWLSPAQVAYKLATQRFTAQGVELTRLRAELSAVAQPVDASKAVREDIAAANLRLDAINQEIKAVAPLAEGGPAVEQALVQFLRRQAGLTLIRTGTVSTTPLLAATAAVTAGAAGTQPVLSRRGLELSVSGSYADMVGYLRTLETALPTLRWGSLEVKATKQKPELTLQVFVVGVQP
jgi:MSHA biogenesis protein MshJ